MTDDLGFVALTDLSSSLGPRGGDAMATLARELRLSQVGAVQRFTRIDALIEQGLGPA